MNIVIVESPAKAKTVNKYLGSGYRVLASYGHVRDLPSKNGSVLPDQDFEMHWDVDPKSAKRLNLMELTEKTCKWPVGDPATEDFWFCGLPAQAGKPYCEAHVGVAFQPMSSRRDRRR